MSSPFDPERTDISGMMLLEASAGTGKTYALERIVARLVGREENPLSIDRILVVTFTNRAAREMKERIRKLIRNRSNDSSRNETERERYRKALADFDSAAIFTIHGFCRMVLTTWPFESSVPFQQEVVSDGELEKSEVRFWLAGLDESTLDLEMFRTAYRRARSADGLVTRLEARLKDDSIPPGTRVLPLPQESSAFLSLIKNSQQENSSLIEAAESVFGPPWTCDDIQAVFKRVKSKKNASSFEKIQKHMQACRNAKSLVDLCEKMFSDPGECEIKNHFKELLYAAALPDEQCSPEDSSTKLALLSTLKNLIEAIYPYVEIRRNNMESLVERWQQCSFDDYADGVLNDRVEKRKDEQGIVGYSDLIQRVARAIEKDNSPLKYLLRRHFQAALIDEFQDTDPLQWQIFQGLFDTPYHVLVLIGDPKQSIYGFRGTGLQAYSSARSCVKESRRYYLDTNYRSCKPLVIALNTLFGCVFRGQADGYHGIQFQNVKSGREKIKSDAKENIVLRWPRAEIPVSLFACSKELDAATFISSEIRALLDPKNGGKWKNCDTLESWNVSASDIAILVRKVKHEQEILTRLAALGVPAVLFRSRSVFGQALADSIRGFLSALDSPQNISRWRAVLLGDFFRLPQDILLVFEGEGHLDFLLERAKTWREIFLAGGATEVLESFLEFSSTVSKWAENLGRLDVASYLSKPWNERVIMEDSRQWQDWCHLVELIQKKQSDGLCDPMGILRWMENAKQQGDVEGQDDALRLETESPAVRVMTMHAAKGLEFPLVFIYDDSKKDVKRNSDRPYRFDDKGTLLVDRLCREKYWERHCAYEWEEVKRLFYVALTRAVWKVWIPISMKDVKPTKIDFLLYLAAGGELTETFAIHKNIKKSDFPVFHNRLQESLINLSQQSDPILSLDIPENGPPLPLLSLPSESTEHNFSLAPLPLDIPTDRDPSTGSYTALIRQLGDGHSVSWDDSVQFSDRDVDAISSDGSLAIPDIPLWQERGAIFGTLLHSFLEECNFSLAKENDKNSWLADKSLDEFFLSLSCRYYSLDWYQNYRDDLKLLIRNALRCPIPGIGRLCDLDDSCKRSEIDFQMAVPKNSKIDIRYKRVNLNRGYLKGVIDLLIRVQGKWWIVDWKSNLPHKNLDPWSSDSLAEMMDNHEYHFQYELYFLALYRTLSGELGRNLDWDSEIGGAAYLFLRALNENNTRGIYSNKPSLERMQSLAQSMGLEGLIQ